MADQWSRFQASVQQHLAFMPAETFDYSLNISLQHRYLYVETPKVCCSTIKLNLQRLETGLPGFLWPEPMDVHDRAFSPLLRPSQVLDFPRVLAATPLYTFCFVRNPYTRLLSAYLDKIRGNRPPKRSVLQVLGRDEQRLEQEVSFGEFVEAISRQTVKEMNPHWRPQYYQTLQNTLHFDFIGRYENFAADFGTVLQRLSPGFEHAAATEARHRTGADDRLDDYYTDALFEWVYRLYEPDFTFLGYPPGR